MSFPPLWEGLESLIAQGRLVAPEEVLEELKKKSDSLLEWVSRQQVEGLFVPVDDPTQEAMSQLLASHPRLVNTQRNRSMADPWVMSLAQVRRLTVVTDEKRSGNLDKPKIPDICDTLGVPCVRLIQLFRQEGWVLQSRK